MWAILASMLAARRGQAVIVALIALVASAAGAAAPWYAVTARHQVAVDTMAGASNLERLVVVSSRVTGEEPVEDESSRLRAAFRPESFTSVFGAQTTLRIADHERTEESDVDGPTAGPPPLETGAALVHREDVCRHLQIDGACPDGPEEVLIPQALAEAHQLAAGDQILAIRTTHRPQLLRVAGSYQVLDPSDPYWGAGDLVGQLDRAASREILFAPFATVQQFQFADLTYELVAQPEAIAEADVDELRTQVAQGLVDLRAIGYNGRSDQLDGLLERIRTDQRDVVLGVGVAVVVLLLLTWFTLVVVARGAISALRRDVGWWRLHGAPTGRGWLVALGQSMIPLLCGAALGAAAGAGLGQLIAGTTPDLAPDSGAREVAWQLTGLLVGLTVAGGVLAMVVTKVGTMRTGVRDLLRRVPPRGRRWRRSLVDILVLLVAGAAVGQGLVTGQAVEGVALLAPPLAVLAVALVAAWGVPPLAAAVAGRALYAGRLATALVATSLARRPGNHRVFALMAVAVALVTVGFVDWDRTQRDQSQRADYSAGADRVITVRNTDPAQLLAAVRAVDPSGHHAMAVVAQRGLGEAPSVLAVDSPRLGVVAGWREEYGQSPQRLAELLRSGAPDPVVITAGTLEVEAAGTGPEPVHLELALRRLDTGEPVTAWIGPLAAQPATYPAQVSGCAAAGCRLVGLKVSRAPGDLHRAPPGTTVDIYRLAGAGDVFADPTRWRPPLGHDDLGPIISAGGGDGADAVSLTMPVLTSSPGLTPKSWVHPMDAPAPLPVVAAGWAPDPTEPVRLSVLPGTAVPVQVAATVPLLPVHGEPAVLVDLEYADRLIPVPPERSISQVWLSASAPPAIVDQLREAGLSPVREQSRADLVQRLRSEGRAVGIRFQTAVALVGLLLVTGAVVMFSVQERAGRAAELAALRAQGLGRRVARLVGYGGLTVVAAGAVVVGLLAGLLGAVISQLLDPGFVDGWRELPAPPYRPLPFAGAAVLAGVLLGGAALLAAMGLHRRRSSGGGEA